MHTYRGKVKKKKNYFTFKPHLNKMLHQPADRKLPSIT